MRLKFLLYTVLPLLAAIAANNVYGQEVLDTLAHRTDVKSVKVNELYFEAQKAKQHNDTKGAIDLFEQFTVLDPNNAVGYYELSVLYDEARKTDKAEANIKKAIALSKDNKWYNINYSALLARQGKFLEAADVAARVADKENGDANYAMQASSYYERAKKYSEALIYLDKALVLSGSDDDILMQKVSIYLEMDKVDKATDVARQLISQDARNSKYYKLLGDLYENNKMPEKVLEVYKDAEKAIPGDPVIEMGLSEYYLKTGDSLNFRAYAKKGILNPKLDATTQIQLFYIYIQNLSDAAQNTEGIPLLLQLIDQHPGDAQLLGTYGDFLASDQQIDKAIVEYKKSLAVKASNFEIWNRLLNAYAYQNATDSLIKYSEKVLRLFPNQAIVHYYNGLGHYNKKEYPAAISAINRAIDMIPDSDTKKLTDFYSMLGEVYNTTKQYQLSDNSFDKALEKEPKNATVLNNYSYFLSERGEKLDKARMMSEKSLQLRPNETTFLDTYGWILYKMGDYEKARENIERAANANDRKADGTIYDHLGDVYYKLKDKAKALQNWKIAKEKGVADPRLDKKISEEKLYE
ncbi:hypothetical protein CJD36_019645 [Flavipsychrobacter stenotrophus]|uniref:Uncharacterized protein n=1 Tax=Flavipsychrobacter stenotrophus TaxID=2077091 RepID=A0A2S7SSD4_9BACT|nr:tetratricopeptide repeat protein [Flavipsychrobacter stenotrophus]PQJ09456.1 hypothetical protein CJD36_019645 [Flavipsychrobacter stenotrophus]